MLGIWREHPEKTNKVYPRPGQQGSRAGNMIPRLEDHLSGYGFVSSHQRIGLASSALIDQECGEKNATIVS